MPTTPVPPATDLCEINGIVSFRPGLWNGVDVTEQDERDMVANFAKFSTGNTPYYKPYISINHKDELAAGYVKAARMVGNELVLDGTDVPVSVGSLVKSKSIQQPSIEFWRPTYEGGKIVDGFMQPDGQYCPTCVLKCVTLLGADAPAVKGLPPLPDPVMKYRDKQRAKALRFGCTARTTMSDAMLEEGKSKEVIEANTKREIEAGKDPKQAYAIANSKAGTSNNADNEGFMGDRAQMIAALQKMGFDVSKITDAIPDEVIAMFLKGIQAQSQKPVEQNADGIPDSSRLTNPDPAQMADYSDMNNASGAPAGYNPTNDPRGPAAQNLPSDDGRGNLVENHDSKQNLPLNSQGNVVKAGETGGGAASKPTGEQTKLDGSMPADDMGSTGLGIVPSTNMGEKRMAAMPNSPPKQTTVIHKFSDTSGKTPPAVQAWLDHAANVLNGLAQGQQVLVQQQVANNVERKKAKVFAFADRARAAKNPPSAHLLQTYINMLLKLDDTKILKFSDGSGHGSTLDAAIGDLTNSLGIRPLKTGEQLPDVHPGEPKQPKQPFNQQRKDEMLKNDPLFADLKRQQEKKAKQAAAK